MKESNTYSILLFGTTGSSWTWTIDLAHIFFFFFFYFLCLVPKLPELECLIIYTNRLSEISKSQTHSKTHLIFSLNQSLCNQRVLHQHNLDKISCDLSFLFFRYSPTRLHHLTVSSIIFFFQKKNHNKVGSCNNKKIEYLFGLYQPNKQYNILIAIFVASLNPKIFERHEQPIKSWIWSIWPLIEALLAFSTFKIIVKEEEKKGKKKEEKIPSYLEKAAKAKGEWVNPCPKKCKIENEILYCH